MREEERDSGKDEKKAVEKAINNEKQELICWRDVPVDESVLGKSVKDKGGLANRAIEKRELKRIAIDLLTKPFDLSTTESHYINEDYKTVNRSARFQQHNEVIKFFEQAFDWEIM